MSLVNDLLIELDRQKEAPAQNSAGILDDLAPRRNARSGAGRIRLSSALLLALTVLFIVVGISSITSRPLDHAHDAPPSVSARSPKQDVTAPGSPLHPTEESAFLPDTRTEDGPVLRAIVLQKRAGFARLQIETDGTAAHVIERSGDDRSLVLFLDSTRLAAPLTSLDLADTPIRSMSTYSDKGGLRLELQFDSRLEIKSQSLESAAGTTLLVDLQSLSVPSPALASQARVSSRSAQANEIATPPVAA